jgi:hypothetical protein
LTDCARLADVLRVFRVFTLAFLAIVSRCDGGIVEVPALEVEVVLEDELDEPELSRFVVELDMPTFPPPPLTIRVG